MRSTAVPAQVTTVEDKIAGNLGVHQILLLMLPIFGGAALFVVLPPFFNYSVYKVVLIVILASLSGLLAVRIRGRILLHWLLAIARYNLRPRYYVFSKNSQYLRDAETRRPQAETTADEPVDEAAPRPSLPKLSIAELQRIEDLIANPKANLRFETTKKGGLRVRITEVE